MSAEIKFSYTFQPNPSGITETTADVIVDYSKYMSQTRTNSAGDTYESRTYPASGSVTGLVNGIETPFRVGFVVYDPTNAPTVYDLVAQSADGHILNFMFKDQEPTSIDFENAAISSAPPNPPSANYSEHNSVPATYTDVVCFCTGTLIRTICGDIAVEELAVGDLLPTLHAGTRPVRWIGRQHFDGSAIAGEFLSLPVCIKANAFADGQPRRDLWVSPGHAFHLDGALVYAYSLINGRSIVQAEAVESVTYWHVELDEHEIIFAEGCATESYLDNQQDRPDAAMGLEPARPADLASRQPTPCAPLLKDGPLLDAIRQQIAARAWIAPQASGLPGPLKGFLDRIVDGALHGWAMDEAAPDVPVYLDVLVDGRRLTRIMANRYRADLRLAGLGSGCCSFSVAIPADVAPDRIEVRRAADGCLLQRSDAYLAQVTESLVTASTSEAPKGLRLVHAA